MFLYLSPFLSPQTTVSLNQTNSSVLSTRERLANLSARLGQLEDTLADTLADLVIARRLTEEAENASAAVEQVRVREHDPNFYTQLAKSTMVYWCPVQSMQESSHFL